MFYINIDILLNLENIVTFPILLNSCFFDEPSECSTSISLSLTPLCFIGKTWQVLCKKRRKKNKMNTEEYAI